MATVEIRYKCRCMPAEAAIQVPVREEGDDVVDWVRDTIGAALAVDHLRRSPMCRSRKTEYVKIPAPENAPWLGGTPRLDG